MIGPRVPNRVASACYSMPARISLGSFDTDYAKTPGPAQYGTTTPDVYQKKSPTYSMLSRNYMPGGKFALLMIWCFPEEVRHLGLSHMDYVQICIISVM